MVNPSGVGDCSAVLQSCAGILSPYTAPQQLGAGHAYLNELGRGSADVIKPDYPTWGRFRFGTKNNSKNPQD